MSTPDLAASRVLVTGGSGFIGSHLTRRLVGIGADVHVLTSAVSSVYPTRLTELRGAITLHEGNLTDRTAMQRLAADVRPDVVFHLAAYTHVGKSWQRIDECVQSNVQGTINLLQALDRVGYQRFVNTGTSEIYGAIDVPFHEDDRPMPVSPYAVSKHSAEMFCRVGWQSHGWPIVRLRPFNAYGPAQSPDRIVPEVITRALTGQRLRMTSGTQTREFNYVEDLVDGFVRAATVPGIEGELINLGCGRDVSIAELARTLLALMGDPIEPELGALPDRPVEIWAMRADAGRAEELLDWTPVHSLEEGLERTIAWYRRELEERPASPFLPGIAPAG